jgi:hypothetical protein
LLLILVSTSFCAAQTFTPVSQQPTSVGGIPTDMGGCFDSNPTLAGNQWVCSNGGPLVSTPNATVKLLQTEISLLSTISKDLQEIKGLDKNTNEAIVKNINEFSVQLREALNKRFDELKVEIAAGPEIQKLRKELQDIIDTKINDLVVKNSLKEPNKKP